MRIFKSQTQGEQPRLGHDTPKLFSASTPEHTSMSAHKVKGCMSNRTVNSKLYLNIKYVNVLLAKEYTFFSNSHETFS